MLSVLQVYKIVSKSPIKNIKVGDLFFCYLMIMIINIRDT